MEHNPPESKNFHEAISSHADAAMRINLQSCDRNEHGILLRTNSDFFDKSENENSPDEEAREKVYASSARVRAAGHPWPKAECTNFETWSGHGIHGITSYFIKFQKTTERMRLSQLTFVANISVSTSAFVCVFLCAARARAAASVDVNRRQRTREVERSLKTPAFHVARLVT